MLSRSANRPAMAGTVSPASSAVHASRRACPDLARRQLDAGLPQAVGEPPRQAFPAGLRRGRAAGGAASSAATWLSAIGNSTWDSSLRKVRSCGAKSSNVFVRYSEIR
ncbi:hypothetical protein [Burkholderia ubonensis]|uniref:hypothetical protein n=1 Tax=Burkholderia ubonensis TaxID=101571 RepID=UPI001E40DE58|nr:hypothetical protein [Burkholderia ubonensis]